MKCSLRNRVEARSVFHQVALPPLGVPKLEVVAHTDRVVSLQAPAASTCRGAQLDIFPETAWMLTHEAWDQVWFWPDRAGERYGEVFDRFLANHHVGQVVPGYHFAGGLSGFTITPDPRSRMSGNTARIART